MCICVVAVQIWTQEASSHFQKKKQKNKAHNQNNQKTNDTELYMLICDIKFYVVSYSYVNINWYKQKFMWIFLKSTFSASVTFILWHFSYITLVNPRTHGLKQRETTSKEPLSELASSLHTQAYMKMLTYIQRH